MHLESAAPDLNNINSSVLLTPSPNSSGNMEKNSASTPFNSFLRNKQPREKTSNRCINKHTSSLSEKTRSSCDCQAYQTFVCTTSIRSNTHLTTRHNGSRGTDEPPPALSSQYQQADCESIEASATLSDGSIACKKLRELSILQAESRAESSRSFVQQLMPICVQLGITNSNIHERIERVRSDVLTEQMEKYVRKASWFIDAARQKATLVLEIGAGEMQGVTVIIRADLQHVRVAFEGRNSADLEAWKNRLRDRLASQVLAATVS